MFINAITTTENFKRGFANEAVKRVSTYGKTNGMSVCIDNWKNSKGITFLKRFVMWDDRTQKIVNKVRNEKGKFDRIG